MHRLKSIFYPDLVFAELLSDQSLVGCRKILAKQNPVLTLQNVQRRDRRKGVKLHPKQCSL